MTRPRQAIKNQFGMVTAEEKGTLLEGWVLTLLRAYAEEQELYHEIAYWSPLQAKQTEVDFLLKRGSELLAVEVKSQSRYSTAMLSGLRAIAELPHVARRILVYGGSRSLRTSDGIDIWPVRRLLQALEKGGLWP